MQLTDVLRGGRQCDEDGTEIIMSRQACHEAANEIERLNLELQKRDKCSFMGPMRDCLTHGESKELSALRNRLQEIGDLAASSRNGPGLREVLAEIERMSTETPNVQIEAPDAALSRKVASNAGLGVAVPVAPTFGGAEK